MSNLSSLSREQLLALKKQLTEQYDACRAQGLQLNMARGKPGREQLDLSTPLLTCVSSAEACISEDGTDCRNYGGLDGLPGMKRLFADLLEVRPENVMVGGNSSLNLMYDTIARAMLYGVLGGTPWSRLERVKFLCPVPGYDRHFTVCESLGIEMVPVEMREDGPDMATVKDLAKHDPAVKGIWCVPKYSNPEGKTYSDAVVDAFAALRPAAADFRIFWDNAYCVHHIRDEHDELKNILDACAAQGRPDMVYLFTSTSKITFPGAGVAAMAASETNIADIRRHLSAQTIGPDKLNQLRHLRFFKDRAGVEAHMKKHQAILAPKFAAVQEILQAELGGLDIAEWTHPHGGYFISFNAPDGCAARIVQLCREAGVVTTPAGATYPYGRDPRDRNIRIAPSVPPLSELRTAISLFTLCVKLAAVEKLGTRKPVLA
ncbi:aminotransferase class I/II-fold pyridoxal phosphate-dependent enzyme [Ethanoligenens harbinense]|uniref:Putative transcriptional regulator, GntR family n=1 Tax=Ethanoligenens harbinense (strain DSM 18485 / JCM 12961 / CGMCC 1.5033 / YUAN-3) TaxID=663278 RepID=E6U7Y8_ETHHY|nr:aminotransferase class I/II-fold pyridoxal phosphate-dependent enzyme [Ethanoligenens harbinense]ADU25920.1 putative transcriptional regulator, GntR family [Ethanoligenens harbinense YUAN-3]AVQ95075.1 aminotransferase [Ethanoligenens harbinense YUAN-3]AYF37766.1 aminotransferase [Ethanoligenens harbinense]AYF40488.1 aminotransferase [Ethanoligenens harbinense]QCN91321.1 aminotransferase class I/II-fold pyridoxal phosphate-dependent enzyme [Ethanoligenens harbinense]